MAEVAGWLLGIVMGFTMAYARPGKPRWWRGISEDVLGHPHVIGSACAELATIELATTELALARKLKVVGDRSPRTVED